jgi:hypothetical protein
MSISSIKIIGLAITAAVLGLYAAVAAPQLPDKVVLFFDSYPGRFLFILLIALSATTDIHVGLVVTIAYLFMFMAADAYVVSEQFSPRKHSLENFSDDVTQDTPSTSSSSSSMIPENAQQLLDTALCAWYKTLDEKHNPKKSAIAKEKAQLIVNKYAANIRTYTEGLSEFDIQTVANSATYHYQTKTVQDICSLSGNLLTSAKTAMQSVGAGLGAKTESFYSANTGGNIPANAWSMESYASAF